MILTPCEMTEAATRAALADMTIRERNAYRNILEMHKAMIQPDPRDVALDALHIRILDELAD